MATKAVSAPNPSKSQTHPDRDQEVLIISTFWSTLTNKGETEKKWNWPWKYQKSYTDSSALSPFLSNRLQLWIWQRSLLYPNFNRSNSSCRYPRQYFSPQGIHSNASLANPCEIRAELPHQWSGSQLSLAPAVKLSALQAHTGEGHLHTLFCSIQKYELWRSLWSLGMSDAPSMPLITMLLKPGLTAFHSVLVFDTWVHLISPTVQFSKGFYVLFVSRSTRMPSSGFGPRFSKQHARISESCLWENIRKNIANGCKNSLGKGKWIRQSVKFPTPMTNCDTSNSSLIPLPNILS